jgi:ligand-binding sensor domain-containing protein/two-component sensor histidine kinase
MHSGKPIVVKGTTIRLFVALVLAFLNAQSLFSQLITTDVSQYGHRAWRSRDGYFPDVLTSVTQTKDGYIWLSSGSGLTRFDGVQFFALRAADGRRVPGFSIWKVFGARDGSLWMGGNGLAQMKDGKIHAFPEFNGESVFAIMEDHEGSLWVGGLRRGPFNKLCRIRSGTVNCYGDSHTFGNWIHSLFEDKNGNLWVGAETGLWRWLPGTPKVFPDNDTTAATGIVQDAGGQLIIGKASETHYLSKEGKNRIYPRKLDGKNIDAECLLTDRKGGLWIGTASHGLVHIFGGRMDTYTGADGLSGDFVYSLFEDREGNIWATTTNGLDAFRPLPIPTVTGKQGLSDNAVTSVLPTGSTIWVGTFDALNRITGTSITNIGIKDGLLGGGARSLYSDAPGKLLISTGTPDGLMWLEDGHLIRLHTRSGENMFVVTTDGEGGFWFSNRESGLIHVHANAKPADIFPWQDFGEITATAMQFDVARKGLWLAFNRGDLVFFQDGQVKERYTLGGNQRFNDPRDLQIDSGGAVWVASQEGLTRLSQGRLNTLSSRNGLPCNGIAWKKEDDLQSTWIKTSCGVVHLQEGEMDKWARDPNIELKIADYFDNVDGAEDLTIPNYYSPAVAIANDGRLLYVTLGGLAVIDPKNIPDKGDPPPVDIQAVQADEHQFHIGDDSSLDLPPDIHVLRVSYAALSFRNPQKIRYRYKLEGYDPDWSEPLTSREAVYTRLPHGHYRFHVVGCNENGVWNEIGDTVDFQVQARFFETRWFLVLCVAIAGALIWLMYHARVRYLCRRVAERLEAQTEERLQISHDLHDTLIQGVQGMVLSFHALTQEPALDNTTRGKMTKILNRAEELLEEGRERIKTLRPAKFANQNLRDQITSIGSHLITGASPVFKVSLEGDEIQLKPVAFEQILLVCREAVTNAFRHGDASRIDVTVRFTRKQFSILIRDDGRGLSPMTPDAEQAESHFGIVGMRERAARLGAKFDIRNASEESGRPGTLVTIDLPAKIAYL